MPSLYQITQDLMAIINEMEASGLDPEVIQDTLEANREEFEAKASAIVGHIKNMKAEVEIFKAESKRLAEEAKKIEAKTEFWSNYLDANMKALNIKELKDGVHKISYRKGLEVVEIDETILPKEYHETKYVPLSKTKLKYFIKEEGREIPGVRIVRKEDSLVIK